MKLGTIAYNNKIYNLNYIEPEELKDLINKMELDENKKIELLAILNWIYAQKVSSDVINTKVNNQLNSMNTSIERINPKFVAKSKSYEKIEEMIKDTLNKYEQNLKTICNIYDSKISELILQKSEKELVKENEKDEKNILNLKKEIKKLSKKIMDLNEQKKEKVFSAMETENKAISTQIRKTHNIKSIKKFFINKFNTYNVIVKSVINPVNVRIEEFKTSKLNKDNKIKQLELAEIKQKIKLMQNQINNNSIKSLI